MRSALALLVLGALTCGALRAQDVPGHWVTWPGQPPHLQLRGWWAPAPGPQSAGPRPAVLLLHGCGGMVDAQGQPDTRTREHLALLHREGWHVLAVDSLGPRGEREICTQRNDSRRVKVADRRADAHSALQHLATLPGVDPQRLALLGWSNGGSTVLSATNALRREVRDARLAPAVRLAVAFYPGCESEHRRGYRPAVPLLLLLGLADDWTPAAPCQALEGEGVTVRAWEGAHHGFDSGRAVRLRTDVPNGASPGSGVHVGGHPQARREAQVLLLESLHRVFQDTSPRP